VQLKNIPEKWISKAIMLMIQNNLDYAVAHPHELITYGVMVLFFKTGHNTYWQCNTCLKWQMSKP
jgi:urocanate hydratase